MKIAYATYFGANDILAWSGTIYHIAQALRKQDAGLYCLDSLAVKPALLSRLRNKFYRTVLHKTIRLEADISALRRMGNEIVSNLQPDTDVIFSPASILQLPFLNTGKLKVCYADAIFANSVNHASWLANLAAFQIREWNKWEKKALEVCDLALFASDWAAQSAIEYYQVDPVKVKVVPFGANIQSSYTADDIEKIIDLRTADTCRLIFVGVEWERKGGDFALQVSRRLHEKGIPVHLDIVGIHQKDLPQLPPYVTNHGFILKTAPEGMQHFHQLMTQAHFFLLPTRFEPYGIVFAEASAYGLPSLAPKTGGITTVIHDNRNGMTFDLSASPEEYADYIARLFNDREAYKRLALSSYDEYATRLNWDTAGRTIMNLIKEKI